MTKDTQLIQVFVKAPEPGKVKTPLIPELGETLARDIHVRLLESVLAQVQQAEVDIELWVAGDMSHPYVQELGNRFTLFEQHGIDLGERMYNALLHGLQCHQHVLLVGGDAYSLTPGYLAQAFVALQHQDMVFGPAQDGGYILVGANKLHPDTFLDIDWGTASVLQEQLENCERCGLHTALLESRWDIDTVADIKQYAPELLQG